MKKETFYLAIFIIPILLFSSCNQGKTIPPTVNGVNEAKKLITNKTWQVVDVATIQGSGESFFDKDESKNEAVVAPDIESLNWFGEIEGIEKGTDFTSSTYKENMKIEMAFNKDSIATTKGMEAKKQIFYITDKSVEDEPKGLRLTLTGDSKAFASMGLNKSTMTYYILGANEDMLYLLTPMRINDLKVVLLLKAK